MELKLNKKDLKNFAVKFSVNYLAVFLLLSLTSNLFGIEQNPWVTLLDSLILTSTFFLINYALNHFLASEGK